MNQSQKLESGIYLSWLNWTIIPTSDAVVVIDAAAVDDVAVDAIAAVGDLWSQLYKNRSSRKIDSKRLFSRE